MKLKNTERLMKSLISEKRVESYAVFVYKDGDTGFINSPDVDEYTYFDVASMGKVLVTSTLILQAVSRRLLSLDGCLGDFLPFAPEDKKAITVKQLLTHSSGILRYPITKRAEVDGNDAIAEEIMSYPLKFAPDTDYEYSCNGYILLGFILEKIYKKPLEAIYFENIAEPLGLERTSFEIGLDEENAALCYSWKEGHTQRFDDVNVLAMGKVAGSGGEQSCLADIRKFVEAVLSKDERLYKKELFGLAETDYTPYFSEGRGLGYWMVDKRFSDTGKLFEDGSFGHCGYCGQSFFISRKQNMYVIILTDATRCLNRLNGYTGCDYGEIMKMRANVHNAILEDLK